MQIIVAARAFKAAYKQKKGTGNKEKSGEKWGDNEEKGKGKWKCYAKMIKRKGIREESVKVK